MSRGSGLPAAPRGEGNPIRRADDKRYPAIVPGFEDWPFFFNRWIRETKTTSGTVKTWCLLVDGKHGPLGVAWADTRPECIRQTVEWLRGSEDWLAKRLGRNWVEETVGELAIDDEPDELPREVRCRAYV